MKRSNEEIYKYLIERIISKLPYRITVTQYQDLHIFTIFDNTNNECATLQLTGSQLTISSLRYDKSQHDCKISGTNLLKDILQLCPRIVSNIKVEDKAYKIIQHNDDKYRIPLTPVRKFIYDKGWYEKFGFLPYSHTEWKEYDESYKRFRMSPFSLLSSAMWILTSSLYMRQIESLDESMLNDIFTQMFGFSEVDGYDLYKFEKEYDEYKIRLDCLMYFFEHFGVQKTTYNENIIQKLNFDIQDFEEITVWKKLKPKAAMKQWKQKNYTDNDIYKYMTMMCEICKVLSLLNLLKTPEYLQYNGNL